MTDDNKPPIFSPSFVIDPANHEPRSGKSALMNQMMAELAGKANVAETIIGNWTLAREELIPFLARVERPEDFPLPFGQFEVFSTDWSNGEGAV